VFLNFGAQLSAADVIAQTAEASSFGLAVLGLFDGWGARPHLYRPDWWEIGLARAGVTREG